MKKTVFASTLALAMSQAAFAQEVEPNNSSGAYWGVGIGTAIGAVLGGPVGAAAGAALGGSVGFGHDKSEALEQTEKQLDTHLLQLSAKDGELKRTSSELDRAKSNLRELKRINALHSAELADLKAQALSEREQTEMLANLAKHYTQEVYYRYNESSIPSYAKARIDALAQFMTEHPNVHLSLAGHTDLLGAEDANLALSQARVDAIRDYLIDQGVRSERIGVHAFGETHATVMHGDTENYVLDRRVAIELRVPESSVGATGADTQPLAVNAGGR